MGSGKVIKIQIQKQGRRNNKNKKNKFMAKVIKPFAGANKGKLLVYSKRTIKKSGGDDFTHNVRCVRLKSKRSRRK